MSGYIIKLFFPRSMHICICVVCVFVYVFIYANMLSMPVFMYCMYLLVFIFPMRIQILR